MRLKCLFLCVFSLLLSALSVLPGAAETGDSYGVPVSENESSDSMEFFSLWEAENCLLPATGVSLLSGTSIPEISADLNYAPLHMQLQLSTLNVMTDLVMLPRSENTWQVKGLDWQAGLLEGSSIPGEGYTVIAAHSTLSEDEYGPFALLGTMNVNDMIAVNVEKKGLLVYRVYANELLRPDDISALASIAGQGKNTLVLVTCENESNEGVYLNRRVIFAKPAGK